MLLLNLGGLRSWLVVQLIAVLDCAVLALKTPDPLRAQATATH
jgi:hypothetical protein